MNDSLASTATALASADVPVFPCQPNGKVPLTPHGFHDATADLSQIRAWWERWLQSQPEGARNGSLFWAACRAIEGGHTDLDDLIEAAEITGLPLDEINRTVESALTRIQGARS